jgi:hypothetical protein
MTMSKFGEGQRGADRLRPQGGRVLSGTRRRVQTGGVSELAPEFLYAGF